MIKYPDNICNKELNYHHHANHSGYNCKKTKNFTLACNTNVYTCELIWAHIPGN